MLRHAHPALGPFCLGMLWGGSALALPPTEEAVVVAPPSQPAATAEPDPEGAKGLLLDVERIVAAQERVGWFVDRLGQEKIASTVQESLCFATPAARQEAWLLAKQHAREVGEPRVVFAREGEHVTASVARSLRAERVVQALERGVREAANDCPFWAKPKPGFLGVHTDRNRFTLNGESGGNLQLRRSEGRWTFGGGGLGRLLGAFGVGSSITLLSGVEFGGGAMLRPGEGETRFVINYFPALPVIFRLRDLDWHYDLEMGPVALFQSDNTNLSFGGRVGLAIGTSALLTGGVIPWAGIVATYEHYLSAPGRASADFLRGGLRFGVSWDP